MDTNVDCDERQQQQSYYQHNWKAANLGNSLSDSRDYDTNSLSGSPPNSASSPSQLQLDFDSLEEMANGHDFTQTKTLASLLTPTLDSDSSSQSSMGTLTAGEHGDLSSIYGSHTAGEQQVLQPLSLSLTLEADDELAATYTLFGAPSVMPELPAQTQVYADAELNAEFDDDDIDDELLFTLRPLDTVTPLLLTSTSTSSITCTEVPITVIPISSYHTTSAPTSTTTATTATSDNGEMPSTTYTYNLDDICFTLEYQFQNQKLVQVQPPTVVSLSMLAPTTAAATPPTTTVTTCDNGFANSAPSASNSPAYFNADTR